ncbi:uncharacterized protein FOBCDRAFT_298917 [Fusarium oxysporum Fo47]|uniref:uncharacterized protein n=1 Tax=Fusarium oxysporum Fo47 TaxID=660027 RepID=UPI002869BAED|nr:uncharacterized protein FOBCDRAFT_298917 [Fusarium oxysporum Fo47]WJG36182.1 hypothetical protein FOBCDRAFT_298917 [Fusarium oxysporum Fo47]
MIESTSGFVKSSIPLYHSALKSFIFKCAELLMGIFIFKLFSLIAARSNQFTAYLMFTEDYIQQSLFISSRGLSRGGLVVLLFSLLSITSSLYGTLLWALDSPGYIFQATNTTHRGKLPQIIGAELFNPGLNYSLTGKVDNSHGTPEVVAPTRKGLGIGARIWLDGDGFSVSPDTNAMMPYTDTMNMTLFSSCILFNEGSAVWNCTFNNAEAQSIIEGVTGLPEVHWNDATDEDMDSRYIRPNRVDNIWVSLGTGGGSAFMNQVFTVTKETRRHTFFQSTFKATMVTNPGIPFGQYEVADFVNRTWSTSTDQDSTKEANPLMGRIIYDIMGAQDQGVSYQFGANTADNNNKSALQKNWGYYTPQVNNASMYSLISITTTKITLIRSETLLEAPEPFEKCERSNFQNEAFGGKVTQTDCTSSKAPDVKHGFFGQVDTAAVMITRGLGAARSNISAQSLDEKSLTWLRDHSGAIEALLTARAYSVSIDPSLVELSVDKLMVAMSSLQLFLTCLALVLAAVIWIGLMYSADGHWSSTLLGNLIHTTSEMNEANPGYVKKAPEITLLPMGRKKVLAVDGGTLTISNTGLTSMQPFATSDPFPGDQKGHMEVDAYSLSYGEQYTGRQRLLSSIAANWPCDNSMSLSNLISRSLAS